MNPSALRAAFNLLSLGCALALALALCQGPRPEDGYFRQLAAGRLLAEQGGFPREEPFSFGLPAQAPFDREGWLFSLAAQGLHRLGGLKAAALARGAALALAFLLLLAASFRRGAGPFGAAFFSLAGLVACLPYAGHSPATLSFTLFAAALYLMEGPFWPAFFSRWIWLPLLGALWVNLDATGLLLLPLAWIWAWGEHDAGPEAPKFPRFARLSILSLVSACAFLHPLLWRLASEILGRRVAPAFSPEYFKPAQPALGLLALGLLALAASWGLEQGRGTRRRDAWLFAAFTALGLAQAPALPFAALLAAPLAALRLDLCAQALPAAFAPLRWILKAGLLAAGLAGLPGALAAPPRLSPAGPPAQTLPRETRGFYRENFMAGNVFSGPDWAGFLLWDLAPDIRVFWERRLRPQALADGAAALAAAPASRGAKPAWEKALERQGAQFAWLPLNSPLARAMARSQAWQPLDFDSVSVFYARVAPERAALVKALAPRGLRPGDLEDPFDGSRLPQVEADLEARLSRRPQSGILHYFQARLWLERGKEALARQWLERGIRAEPDFAPSYRLLGELRAARGDREGAAVFLKKAAALEAGK